MRPKGRVTSTVRVSHGFGNRATGRSPARRPREELASSPTDEWVCNERYSGRTEAISSARLTASKGPGGLTKTWLMPSAASRASFALIFAGEPT